jgi:hypothetical protein
MSEYMPGDGEPVDMSQVTLGERYGSEDMYRDMGIERPLLDVPWIDTVRDVTITIGDGPVDV